MEPAVLKKHKRKTKSLFDHLEYVSITMEFKCNLKCNHCMIEGTMDWLQPQTLETFESLMKYNRENKAWKGLILTGSEITLHRELPQLASKARESGFDYVRIQTHGMHLSQKNYVKKLIDAGVNEFFVSVAGHNDQLHDEIVKISGAFDRTVKGLENIAEFDSTRSITNTVVTNQNYKFIPDVIDALKHIHNLVQMEFWVYWPMKEIDDKNLVVSHQKVLPYLQNAIKTLQQSGRGIEVKNFPECLLKEDGDALYNQQPQLYIDDRFWNEFMKNGFYRCVYKEQCCSEECLGLNSAYIDKFGWEEEILSPIPSEK